MKTFFKIHNQAGMTFLEGALCAILVCSMLLGGIAMVDYFGKAGDLQRLVDNAIHESSIRPFKLVSVGGSIGLETQTDILIEHCSQVVATLAERLEQAPLNLTSDMYRIEMGFTEVVVDSESGQSVGFTGSNPSHTESSGSLAIPGELSDLSQQFRLLAHPQGSFPDNSFLYATPSIFGGTTSLGYLDRTVLVGLRVAFSLEESPWRHLYQTVLSDQILSQIKVVALRGDIDS